MERLALAAVLAVALWGLWRIVRRSLKASPEGRGACYGCPIAGECGSAREDGPGARDCAPSGGRTLETPGEGT